MSSKKYSADLVSYFIDFIKETFKSLINDEFRQEFVKVSKDCKVCFVTMKPSIHRIYDRIDNVHCPMTKKFIKETIEHYMYEDEYVEMLTTWTFVEDNSEILHLTELNLEVDVQRLRTEILMYITNLDSYEKFLTLVIRHEVGHMIELIQSYDGKHKSIYESMSSKYHEERLEFRKHEKDIDESDYCRMYHSLSQEHLADMLGGVDIDDLVAMEKILNEISDSRKDITIEINSYDNNEG